VGGQRHAPAALPTGKRPGIHCIGGWVGPRAGLDGCRKFRPPPYGIRSPDPPARSESRAITTFFAKILALTRPNSSWRPKCLMRLHQNVYSVLCVCLAVSSVSLLLFVAWKLKYFMWKRMYECLNFNSGNYLFTTNTK